MGEGMIINKRKIWEQRERASVLNYFLYSIEDN